MKSRKREFLSRVTGFFRRAMHMTIHGFVFEEFTKPVHERYMQLAGHHKPSFLHQRQFYCMAQLTYNKAVYVIAAGQSGLV